MKPGSTIICFNTSDSSFGGVDSFRLVSSTKEFEIQVAWVVVDGVLVPDDSELEKGSNVGITVRLLGGTTEGLDGGIEADGLGD